MVLRTNCKFTWNAKPAANDQGTARPLRDGTKCVEVHCDGSTVSGIVCSRRLHRLVQADDLQRENCSPVADVGSLLLREYNGRAPIVADDRFILLLEQDLSECRVGRVSSQRVPGMSRHRLPVARRAYWSSATMGYALDLLRSAKSQDAPCPEQWQPAQASSAL